VNYTRSGPLIVWHLKRTPKYPEVSYTLWADYSGLWPWICSEHPLWTRQSSKRQAREKLCKVIAKIAMKTQWNIDKYHLEKHLWISTKQTHLK